MSERTLGVLVHGAGWVSTQHIAAFTANPNTEVVAISSRHLASARARAAEASLDVACYDDYYEALTHKGVDIVCVCTPQHVHASNVIAAAHAGKHVVIEKPAAITLDDLRAMHGAVTVAGVKTVVSFVLRWNPLFQELKRMIATDALGQVYYVETDYQSFSGDWWSGWEDGRKATTGRSAMIVGGCHAIDALRWFAAPGEFEAATPVEVFAYAGGFRKDTPHCFNPYENRLYDATPLEYDGLEVALVRFDNGVVGKVSANFECIQPYRFPVEIFGRRGTVRDNRVWTGGGEGEWTELPHIRPDSADVTHHPFQAQTDHFVQCVMTDTESHCNLDDAIKTHEIALALQECYRTNRPVTLPLA